MAEPGAEVPSTPGEALYQELLWVHGALRSDLEKVRRLAAEALVGAPAERIEAEVDSLRTGGPLWRLRTGCLTHCRFVHQHHRLEDVALFPALRRANPGLAPVLEKLEADHRSIATRVEEVEAAVGDLARSDGDGARRRRLAEGLEALATKLLDHLGYEEEHVAETMRSMQAI